MLFQVEIASALNQVNVVIPSSVPPVLLPAVPFLSPLLFDPPHAVSISSDATMKKIAIVLADFFMLAPPLMILDVTLSEINILKTTE
jgi:hypothetical protein